jgi:hypothetical protein
MNCAGEASPEAVEGVVGAQLRISPQKALAGVLSGYAVNSNDACKEQKHN